MSYRERLPQEDGELFVTDGGMETALIFKQGFDLPLFASFTLHAEPAGAAASADLPVAVSFTVETDGRLPNGQSLAEAVEQVDAETDGAPAYFMVNCAHTSHFAHILEGSGSPLERIKGIRVNASMKSHAELDDADVLDDGDPLELGALCRALVERTPAINVVGGCCGTDDRHIREICRSLLA